MTLGTSANQRQRGQARLPNPGGFIDERLPAFFGWFLSSIPLGYNEPFPIR